METAHLQARLFPWVRGKSKLNKGGRGFLPVKQPKASVSRERDFPLQIVIHGLYSVAFGCPHRVGRSQRITEEKGRKNCEGMLSESWSLGMFGVHFF